MPAKKPAPKAAKGKTAASRPAAVKKTAMARKLPAERVKRHGGTRTQTRASASQGGGAPTFHDYGRNHRDAQGWTRRPEVAPKESPSAPSEILAPTRAGLSQALSAADNDESDSVEPGSLLAGPRKRFSRTSSKRGEQYMSKEQTEHFREILHSWKQDLMVEVDRTVSHMKDEAANFPDPNDRATQEEEFSLELRTRDRERKLIRKIDEALKTARRRLLRLLPGDG